MYKVVLYQSSHDLEVGMNEMLEKKYLLFNIAPSNGKGYIAVFVKMQEPTLPTNERQGVEEEILEKNTNILDDGEKINS